MATWRDRCRPIIGGVIDRVGMEDRKALRAALRKAFPFHSRDSWPYKVWLDEIRRQLKLKPSPRRPLEPKRIAPAPNQTELF